MDFSLKIRDMEDIRILDMEMNNELNITLKDFQTEGVERIRYNEVTFNCGSVLAFEMGLGKTLTFASFLAQRRDEENPSHPDLIIVPLCVLTQWKSEIHRLRNTWKVFIYHGSKRVEQLKEHIDSDFVISTYHSLVTRELECYEWNRVVLDEAHNIRNGVETRYKSVPKRAIGAYGLREKSRFCHCITGTPFNNGKNDLLSLMKFVGYDGEDDVKFVDQFVIQKTKENLMDKINTETIFIDSPKEGLQEYKDVLNLYTRISYALKTKVNVIEAREMYSKAMRLMTKLRVFCDIMQMQTTKTVAYEVEDEDADDENENYEYEEVELSHDEKVLFHESSIKIRTVYDKLMEQLPLVPFKRIIVFSSFVTTLNVLQAITAEKNLDILTFQYTGKQNRKDRDDIVTYFTNESETKQMILFASLGAGSCGLNLVPCSTVFLVDISMNPFDELQAINRVHRITQKNKVNVYKFCMKNLIEESILNSHFRKIEEAKSKGLLIV